MFGVLHAIVNTRSPHGESNLAGSRRFLTLRPWGQYRRSMNDPLHYLTIADAAALIKRRALSPVELTASYVERIAALDPLLDAFITRTIDSALATAKAAEADIMSGKYKGPLHGIPFGLKDIYDTAGIRTTAHSRICIDNVPTRDATAVERLYAAGGILLGKLATHEFASGGPSLDLPWPPARNPWNFDHFTGGSSSGAGAAIAAGLMPYALGTDTGGSIRIPAALCGLAGLKPTYGRVSRAGVIPNSHTFDHCGPLTWTVEDCAIVLQAIAGHDPRDPASANEAVPDFRAALTGNIRGLRVGVLRHFWEDEGPVAPGMAQAMDAALEVFRSLGAIVETTRIRSRREFNDVRSVISRSELLSIYDREIRERPGDFSEDFLGRNLAACMFTAGDIVRAQRERRRMLAEMTPLYDRYDVFITATSAPAPRLDNLIGGGFADKWENPSIYQPFNLTGAPALVVCNGYTASGLPLGMQITGRPFDEATVLNTGHAYEKSTGWRDRRPALSPNMTRNELKAPALSQSGPYDAVSIAPEIRRLLNDSLERAGYTLTDVQRKLVERVAPHVLASARRLPRDQQWHDEPAAVFRFPGK